MHVVRLECLSFYDIVREFLLHRNCSRHFSVCVKSEGSAQKNIFLISHSFIRNFITEFGPKNWSLNNHSVGQAELYNQNPLVFQICHFRQLHSSFDWFRLNWLEMSKLPKQILKDLSTSSLLLLMTMIQKKVIVEKNR